MPRVRGGSETDRPSARPHIPSSFVCDRCIVTGIVPAAPPAHDTVISLLEGSMAERTLEQFVSAGSPGTGDAQNSGGERGVHISHTQGPGASGQAHSRGPGPSSIKVYDTDIPHLCLSTYDI